MTVFVTADQHFQDQKLAEGEIGTRPWRSIEEHDEAIIARWNETVGPDDVVFVIGDFAVGEEGLAKGLRLNGHKRLIMGNRDLHRPTRKYLQVFERLFAVHSIAGICLTHIPIHPWQLRRQSMQVNVHGHLHEAKVTRQDPVTGLEAEDPRYRCVSLEHTDYRPIPLDQIRADFVRAGLLQKTT